MKRKIVHIVFNEKFIKDFYDLIIENFDRDEHVFIFLPGVDEVKCKIPLAKNVLKITQDSKVFKNKIKLFNLLNKQCKDADKIVLHSLINQNVVRFLFFYRYLLKKCYWIMWGADVYSYRRKTKGIKGVIGKYMRRSVFKSIGYLVTGTPGDVEIARKQYQSSGKHIRCFNYPSNLYKHCDLPKVENERIVVQIGNSADPTNNHEKIFDLLHIVESDSYTIFCPLSYGHKDYIEKVLKSGLSTFKDKFQPALDFVPLDEYVIQLAKVDIAIFAHKRQQAFGNIITLLGLGKTVYLYKDNPLYDLFSDIGIIIHDIEQFSLAKQSNLISESNIAKVKANFSEKSLIKSLEGWIL
jgi:dTDP-N-acetylfucosamine:lipid II N-acetylfucosaminyltransferase